MTKHTTILESDGFIHPDDMIFFLNFNDDEEMTIRETHELPIDVWYEMGCPLTITVSVEPGDLLND